MICSIINMLNKLRRKEFEDSSSKKSSKIANKLQLNGSYFDEALKKNIKYDLVRVPLGCLIMIGAGLISGLLGIGSGVFKVIALDGAMKMPLKVSTATSNLMMGVTAATSAIVFFFSGSILPEVAAPVVLGVLAGAAIGTRIMPKLHPKVIRVLFVVVMTIFCIQMLYKAVILF